ncbi:hypothetical protein E2562_024710 [Oryza meyeriana var. granulata]|uniref:F-box domain-containing protein n=1 Tax=Oryza meyeriana var. granulata TaxID=110450 RepID=A0A6G1D796_9ORYZ|nr:hypothetical protein E2562_024710 [Oryza meyeriana var. granulata]
MTTGALTATTSSGLTPMTGLGETTASRSRLQTAGSQLYRRLELNDNMSNEVLLRLPPDAPWMLARCLAVSKSWCRILKEPKFEVSYRYRHKS